MSIEYIEYVRKPFVVTAVEITVDNIEQLNKEYGSQILASGEVLAAAGGPAPSDEALGPVHVKGREEPIELFRLA